jgi:predicted ribosome quality control (RQC) complex YloA/Tae2 family protein
MNLLQKIKNSKFIIAVVSIATAIIGLISFVLFKNTKESKEEKKKNEIIEENKKALDSIKQKEETLKNAETKNNQDVDSINANADISVESVISGSKR